jgi:hypothetical protein
MYILCMPPLLPFIGIVKLLTVLLYPKHSNLDDRR